MVDVRRPISRSVPGRIDAERSSRGSMPMHGLRHLSSLDDVHRLWLQAYVARADLAGFQVCQVSRSGGFQVKAGACGRCQRQMLEAGARGSRFTLHVRIPRRVCVTDFDDGLGRTIGLRALWLGSAIGPQGASAWIRSVLQALRFGLAIES